MLDRDTLTKINEMVRESAIYPEDVKQKVFDNIMKSQELDSLEDFRDDNYLTSYYNNMFK